MKKRMELLVKAAKVLSLIEKYEAMNQPHFAEMYRNIYKGLKKELA